MTTTLLFGGTVLVAVAFALWIYLRREPLVPGRGVLAGLRACALGLLVLLLWNPTLPWGGSGDDAAVRVVLLDASRSMAARDSAGETAWSRALAGIRDEVGAEDRLLLFGSDVRTVEPDALDEVEPTDESSFLTPALERAAALGAAEIRVVSDRRLGDPVGAERAIRELGVSVGFWDVGATVRNVGVGEVSLPTGGGPDGAGRAELLLHGEGGEPDDSVELSARDEDGALLARRRVPLPVAGRPDRHVLELPEPEEAGRQPIRIAAELSGDGFPDDDARVETLAVDPDGSGVVLVSLRPDWEPRYLLPVLEGVTGLDARGYLSLAGGRWLPMGRETDRGGAVDGDAVRERLQRAGLVVIHGLGAGGPGWVEDVLTGSGGALVFPADPAGARRVGVEVAGARDGEWYPGSELPPSPLAGELAGVALDGLAPLTAVLPHLGREGTVPLRVHRDRGGPGEAALVLRETEDGRRVVALGSGFWRWGAREGEGREAYRRLWAGVTGWLLDVEPGVGAPTVSPADEPVARDAPVPWDVRGLAGDTLRLRVRRGDSLVTDTTLVPGAGGRILTAALPAGSYGWEATAAALPDEGVEGRLRVSGHSSELLRPRTEEVGSPESAAAGGSADGVRGSGRPLRTHPVPYLLVVGLLSLEWIGRRRQGLR